MDHPFINQTVRNIDQVLSLIHILIERGDYSPSVTLALKIARIFNTSVEDIFTYSDEEDSE